MFRVLGFITYTVIVGTVGVLAGATGLVKVMIFSDKTIDTTVEELNKFRSNPDAPEYDDEDEDED